MKPKIYRMTAVFRMPTTVKTIQMDDLIDVPVGVLHLHSRGRKGVISYIESILNGQLFRIDHYFATANEAILYSHYYFEWEREVAEFHEREKGSGPWPRFIPDAKIRQNES